MAFRKTVFAKTLDLAEAALGEILFVAARDHAASLDDLRLTALVWATTLYGSAILGLAVEQGEIDALDAFDLSRIDEIWQAEQWGEDEEAMQAVEARRRDADALGKLFAALGR